MKASWLCWSCALAVLNGFSPLVVAASPDAASALASARSLAALESRLLAATTRHLDLLVENSGRRDRMKGKSAAGMTALASYLTYEATGKPAYRAEALRLTNQILADMKATKFGVLYIKEKAKEDGSEISGGGPPALGWYASAIAYICHREGNRVTDLSYVAGVLDRFPWNEAGWWAATIDIRTGEPKQPLTKPSPINKNAAMAMAAGMIAEYLEPIDPGLARRLATKARHCLERQIVPAQQPDGFWHYGLTGNDPNEKDVFGYFMLTVCELIQWRELTIRGRDLPLADVLKKAGEFAQTNIAPITDPNHGISPRAHATRGTSVHFSAAEEPKRSFQLGVVLIGTGHYEEGTKIVDEALRHFAFGDGGQDGAQAALYSAITSLMLRHARSPGATAVRPGD